MAMCVRVSADGRDGFSHRSTRPAAVGDSEPDLVVLAALLHCGQFISLNIQVS